MTCWNSGRQEIDTKALRYEDARRGLVGVRKMMQQAIAAEDG